MTDLLEHVLEVARRAGVEAAETCRRVQADREDGPAAMAKMGDEPVTVADYGSQAVILRHVREEFPDHGVIAEEGAEHLRQESTPETSAYMSDLVSGTVGRAVAFPEVCEWIDHHGQSDAEYVWVIDPIDGTKGFLRGGQFAVAIGVLRNREPWVGVLACPNLQVRPGSDDLGVLFVAARDRGTLRESLDGADRCEVRVSESEAPENIRILGSVESAHGDPKLMTAVMADIGIGGGVVRLDSQVKYGVVASGEGEIYLRPRSRPDYREKIWDHVAGVVVVEQAGGRVSDLDGRPLDFTLGSRLEENRGVLATNGAVHDAVLASLRRTEASG